MTSVTIGLKNEKLLKWFNEFHAALKGAEDGYEGDTVASLKRANSDLIAALQAIILQVQRSSTSGIISDILKKSAKR